MFENILIPVSSEFYSKKALERAVFLASKLDSKIKLVYIIEKRTLDRMDKHSNSYRTQHDKDATSRDLVKRQKDAASDIVFEDAKHLLKNKDVSFEEKIVKEEFSDFIKRETDERDYNLVMMGFKKGCYPDYSFFYDVDAPIWIEVGGKSDSILAVCSNLAPNKKVPSLSMELAEKLGWDLHMLYVTDTDDTVEVDETGCRSSRKPERTLLFNGQQFVEKMEDKGWDVHSVSGSLDKEIIKYADKVNPGLIVMGREKKKKGVFGLPIFRNFRKKIAERCPHSILFVK